LEDCGGSSYCLNRSRCEWKQLRDQEEQEWLRKQQELQQQLGQQHEQQQQLQLQLDQQQKQLEEQLEQQLQQLQRRDNTLVLDNSSMLNVLLNSGKPLMVICVGPEQVAAPEPREITLLTDD